MIFVTVGLERFPFDRLIREIDQQVSWGAVDSAVCQIGRSRVIPKYCQWERVLSFAELVRHLEKCSVVIAHAGAGTAVLCMNIGKVPILVPRRRAFGEHVDDHQVGFAQQLDRIGHAVMAEHLDDTEQLFMKQRKYQKFLQAKIEEEVPGTELTLNQELDRLICRWS